MLKIFNRMPVLKALLIQLFAFVCIAPLMSSLPTLTLLEWALFQGIVAAFISYCFRIASWWLPIQLCFFTAVVLRLALELSPLWFCLGFFLLLLIYGKTFQTQVPLYLSSTEVTRVLASLLPQQRNFTFMDLGCGCGGLLSKLNKTHTHGAFYGIEAAPIPYLIGKIRTLFRRPNCNVQWGDLWKQNLGQFDVVYAYLSPVPMPSLWEKASREMQPGSLFISNTFAVPGITPEKIIALNDFSKSKLYIWRM